MNLESMDRLGMIRRRLDGDGRVRVVQLAVELHVSEMTIRRDLDVLVDEGVAHRVRGGAVAVGPQQFAARAEQNSRAKGRIADKLVDLVGIGGAIGVDASSTLQRLAARLAPVRNLTVLTNGLDTFRSLQDHPGVTALLTGGELDESTGSLVGPLATRAAGDVMLRRLFVSASALDPELGSSESTLLDAEAKLALSGAAAEIVLAVDASKLGHRAPARCFDFGRIDFLVTELEPTDGSLDAYRDRVELV